MNSAQVHRPNLHTSDSKCGVRAGTRAEFMHAELECTARVKMRIIVNSYVCTKSSTPAKERAIIVPWYYYYLWLWYHRCRVLDDDFVLQLLRCCGFIYLLYCNFDSLQYSVIWMIIISMFADKNSGFAFVFIRARINSSCACRNLCAEHNWWSAGKS